MGENMKRICLIFRRVSAVATSHNKHAVRLGYL